MQMSYSLVYTWTWSLPCVPPFRGTSGVMGSELTLLRIFTFRRV